MAVAAARAPRRDDGVKPLPEAANPASTHGWRRWALLALGALLAVSVAALMWVLLTRDSADDETARGERDAVTAVTREYAAEAWSFTDDDLDSENTLNGVIDRAEPLITTAFRDTYEGLVAELTPTLAGKQLTSVETSLGAAGVDSLDEDTAVVVADVDVTQTPTQGEPQQARVVWVLTLKKIDGEWRVDKHDDLTAGSQQPPSQQPSPGGAQ